MKYLASLTMMLFSHEEKIRFLCDFEKNFWLKLSTRQDFKMLQPHGCCYFEGDNYQLIIFKKELDECELSVGISIHKLLFWIFELIILLK